VEGRQRDVTKDGLYTSLKVNDVGHRILPEPPSHVRTSSITDICHAALAADMMHCCIADKLLIYL